MRRLSFVVGLASVLLGCESEPPPAMVLYATADHEAVAADFVASLPYDVAVRVEEAPAEALGAEPGLPEVAWVADGACAECFRLERAAGGAVVRGGAPNGLQYGTAALLEAMGTRFYHPERTLAPDALALPAEDDPVFGVAHAPEMEVRGLHLHTLHPIEAYYAFCEPGAENLARAERIIDWVVKNRGNYVQWWLLDDIQGDPAAAEALRAHVSAIADYAHRRGVRVGVGVQLFSGANLQKAFDLTGGGEGAEAEIAERLAVLDGFGFDSLQISFGEFSGEEPDRFIALLDRATEEAIGRWPGLEVTASVHVGDELRVDYMGETDLIYYFLVRFADERIVPWIHTVMYYTLFDDAGGAYFHEDFAEHRGYLYDRLREGEPVAYFPETAYWVAFDNSVPTYLPVYIRARWRDQALIRRDVEAMGLAPLEQHVTFTSGWEWGYWQQDYVTLRSHYEWPESWESAVREMLAPLGAGGEAAAGAITDVADLQFEHLIENRLAPYLAGRDATIDAGFEMGIVAAPDRIEPDELHVMIEADRRRFEENVLARLDALADGTEAALEEVAPVADQSRWIAEIRDGLAVDVHRARFVAALYRAVLADVEGGDPEAAVEEAQGHLEAARVVVERRHADLHDPAPEQIVARRFPNETLYNYGYLREANLLCFWERELAQTRNLLFDAGDRVPGCVL
ncbi:MAG TPA: hypothetical protein RMH99_23585 [Sandaracinaceae bacterium LLY-WYZ-13_1]|nr:hypothetical protein [Sandaracinaceae bacterium LLY-WYZ-13_1]